MPHREVHNALCLYATNTSLVMVRGLIPKLVWKSIRSPFWRAIGVNGSDHCGEMLERHWRACGLGQEHSPSMSLNTDKQKPTQLPQTGVDKETSPQRDHAQHAMTHGQTCKKISQDSRIDAGGTCLVPPPPLSQRDVRGSIAEPRVSCAGQRDRGNCGAIRWPVSRAHEDRIFTERRGRQIGRAGEVPLVTRRAVATRQRLARDGDTRQRYARVQGTGHSGL